MGLDHLAVEIGAELRAVLLAEIIVDLDDVHVRADRLHVTSHALLVAVHQPLHQRVCERLVGNQVHHEVLEAPQGLPRREDVNPEVGDDEAICLLAHGLRLAPEVLVVLIVPGGPVEVLQMLDAGLDVGRGLGGTQRRVDRIEVVRALRTDRGRSAVLAQDGGVAVVVLDDVQLCRYLAWRPVLEPPGLPLARLDEQRQRVGADVIQHRLLDLGDHLADVIYLSAARQAEVGLQAVVGDAHDAGRLRRPQVHRDAIRLLVPQRRVDPFARGHTQAPSCGPPSPELRGMPRSAPYRSQRTRSTFHKGAAKTCKGTIGAGTGARTVNTHGGSE